MTRTTDNKILEAVKTAIRSAFIPVREKQGSQPPTFFL